MPAGEKSESTKKWSTVLKVIGGASAVISLLLALNQATGLLQAFRIHQKEFSDAMKIGQQQQERGDYAAAFQSFKQASELDPVDRKAQSLEAQAAMLWIENAHIDEGQTFSGIVVPLLPVLDKALTHTKGEKAADLVAHIGWANFSSQQRSSQPGRAAASGTLDSRKL